MINSKKKKNIYNKLIYFILTSAHLFWHEIKTGQGIMGCKTIFMNRYYNNIYYNQLLIKINTFIIIIIVILV